MSRKEPKEYLMIMQDIAEKNGGKLLSTIWNGTTQKYSFCFASGNEFEMIYKNIIKSWPKNEKKYLKFNNIKAKSPEECMNLMKKIAEDNNGKLLDTVWKGATKEYWFIDENNRKFSRTYTTMKNRGWINLKTCRGNPLEEMSQIAKSRNGKLLSTVWKGRNTPLEFMDSDGFVFTCTPKGIRIGQWLPDRGLVSEPICRQAFEHIFGYEFPKTRKILDTKITKRKRCLELDGYCKELNIAFEYQGHPSHWNNKDRNYLKVSKVDEEKKYFCESLNIILIQVPKFEDKLQKWEAKSVLDVILQVINKTFLNLNKKKPKLNTRSFNIDFSKISKSKEKISYLQEIAKKNNAELISHEWKGHRHFYIFKSKEGINFNMTIKNYQTNGWPKNIEKYNNLKNGHKKTKEDLLMELKMIAEQNGGNLLSTSWLGNQKKYLFETKNKIKFTINGQSIKENGWPKKYQ